MLITDYFGKASIDTSYAIATTVKTTRTAGVTVLEAFDLSKFSDDTPVFFITYKKTTDPVTDEVTVSDLVSYKALVNTGANTLTNLTVAPGYTDIGNDVGDFVECIPTSYWVNSLIDGVSEALNPDGKIKADAPVDSPQATLANVTPVGSVLDYAGATAPTGWLLCYGQAVSRTTYAALFAVTGTTYGVGNGTTTFNIPDARGRVVAGQDDMGGTSANRLTGLSGGVNGDTLGGAGGAETHTLTEAQMPVHKHNINAPYTTSAGPTTNGSGIPPHNSAVSGGSWATTTADAGSGAAHNNVQPTVILNKIIKT